MKSFRQQYSLAFALLGALLAVLCFQLVSVDVLWFGSGGTYFGPLLQAGSAAVVLTVMYFASGGFRLSGELKHQLHSHRVIALVLVAAVALGAAKVIVQGSTRFIALPADIVFVAMLLATAIFEEILFRGLLFESFASFYQRSGSTKALLWAAVWTSVLFGILHISSDLGSLFRLAAYIEAAVKIAEAALFGICMCALYAKTKSIWPCVLIHFIFDVISELPIFMVTGIQTSTYITGSPADIMVLAIATAILAIPTKWALDCLSNSEMK